MALYVMMTHEYKCLTNISEIKYLNVLYFFHPYLTFNKYKSLMNYKYVFFIHMTKA